MENLPIIECNFSSIHSIQTLKCKKGIYSRVYQWPPSDSKSPRIGHFILVVLAQLRALPVLIISEDVEIYD